MEYLNTEAISQIITALSWLFVVTGAALLAVLAWIGRQLVARLKGIEVQLVQTNTVLTTIERDLRNELVELDRRKTQEINGIERRMVIVETRCNANHGGQQ